MALTDISSTLGGTVKIDSKKYTNVNNVRVKVRQRADGTVRVLIRTDDDVIFSGLTTQFTVNGAAPAADVNTLRDTLTSMFVK